MNAVADRKKKTDEPEEKKPQRSGLPLHVWIDPEINQALLDYLEDTEPRVFKTSAVESALKDFLRNKGYWPPKK